MHKNIAVSVQTHNHVRNKQEARTGNQAKEEASRLTPLAWMEVYPASEQAHKVVRSGRNTKNGNLETTWQIEGDEPDIEIDSYNHTQ